MIKKGEKTLPLKNFYQGKFIVFEGIDGSGKTTVAKMAVEFLSAAKYDVRATFEPTKDSPEAEKIGRILDAKEKADPKVLQELFILDRHFHLVKTIIPALGEGKLVICDRYFFSTLAYGMAQGIEKKWLVEKHREILGDTWILPDAAIIVDTPSPVAAKRMAESRGQKSIFEEKVEFAENVRKNYLALAEDFGNVSVVNGNLPPAEVFGVVKRIILPLIQKNK